MDALERFVICLGTLYRARQIYPGGNAQVARAARRATDALSEWNRPVRVAVLDDEAVVEDRAIALAAHPLEPLLRDFIRAGFENIRFAPGVSPEELLEWVGAVLAGRGGEGTPGIVTGALRFDTEDPIGEPSKDAHTDYGGLLPQVEEALVELAGERADGIDRAEEIAQAIAGGMSLGEELLDPLRGLKTHCNFTFTHALNVSVLSGALARALGASPEVVAEVALAGLCHDLGEQLIPLDILNSPGLLSPTQRAVLDDHPAKGAQLLLTAAKGAHPLAAVVAYQHHRRADGSGYPRVPGGQSHPASLVVAVADVFDAMRTVRPYRDAHGLAETCTTLLAEAAGGRFRPRHVSALFKATGILRPGTGLALSDGRLARVVAEGTADPLAPVVEAEDGEFCDLALEGSPTIVRVCDSAASTACADAEAAHFAGPDPIGNQSTRVVAPVITP